VVLEPELYRHAKRVALEQDKSLKEIICSPLRRPHRSIDTGGQRTSDKCFFS